MRSGITLTLAMVLLLTARMAAAEPSDTAEKKPETGVFDLGATMVESSIRRPETEIVESTDVLVRTAADLLKAQLRDLERETLTKLGGGQ